MTRTLLAGTFRGRTRAPRGQPVEPPFPPRCTLSDERATRTGRRILVVDDEPHIRRLLATTLAQEGFEVVLASDGTRGLAAIEAKEADLVILDLMMPGASGLEILSKIRSNPGRAHTPVIILTAKGQDTDREAAFAGGASDFMTKPFSPKKLIARIHEILDAR